MSGNGDVITLEKEIARLNDRKLKYVDLGDKEIEARLSGLLAAFGIRVQFVN